MSESDDANVENDTIVDYARTSRRFPKSSKFVKGKFHNKVLLVPSFITMVALFCGFLGIISAFKGKYEYATFCIGLAIVLDGLDGRIARRLNATSAFGREFDSMSDLIGFGVAPAVLVYTWAFRTLADDFGIPVSFMFAACAATRLARFNVTATQEQATGLKKNYFDGLPSPGGAAAIASLVYFYPQPLDNIFSVSIVLGYTVLVAGLMVSTIPFFAVKHMRLTEGNTRLNLLFLSLAVALTWYQTRLVVLVVSTFYALSGPVWYFMRRNRSPQATVKAS